MVTGAVRNLDSWEFGGVICGDVQPVGGHEIVKVGRLCSCGVRSERCAVLAEPTHRPAACK